MYVLAADFGTSSVKTAILDENNNLLKTAKHNYEFKVTERTRVEIDVDEVMNAFIQSLHELKEYLPYVEAIGFDTFAPSFLLMDKEGNAVSRIITHLDRRSRQYTKKIMENIGKDEFRNITGTLPHAGGVTLTTLLWFMDHRPELIDRTEKIGHLSTYLFKRMTGEWAIDLTNASITGMYETVKNKGWSHEICKLFNVPERLLPEIFETGDCSGILQKEMAEKMGVKQGTPVMLGMQDVAGAIVGAGNTQTGDVLFISGSSEMISVLSDRPVTNDKYYLRCSPVKGKWQIFSITTAGFILEWFQNEFYREMSKEGFFQKHLAEVLENEYQSDGVRFLPYLTGDRQSLRVKKGSFSGLSLSTKRDDLLNAVIDGIQNPAKITLEECKKIINVNKYMKATGNLVENPSYLKRKRSIFDDAEIEVVDNCPLKGCAVLAWNMLKKNNLLHIGGR